MDRLTSMSVFVKVADLGSFAAAAKELRLSPTMIGKHMRHLEARLGSLLINRSTRRQSLTELGRNYLDHCRRLLEEAEAGDALAEEALRAPRGRLRVAASIAFGAHSLAPTIVKFMKRYPQVTVELVLNDRMIDLVEEGIDVAIRVGPLANSSMMSRALSPYTTAVCASPEYLAERGTPSTRRSRRPRLPELSGLDRGTAVEFFRTGRRSACRHQEPLSDQQRVRNPVCGAGGCGHCDATRRTRRRGHRGRPSAGIAHRLQGAVSSATHRLAAEPGK